MNSGVYGEAYGKNYRLKNWTGTVKMRALDNYKKAGYDAHSLEKHVKGD